jgi:hypothetical protein
MDAIGASDVEGNEVSEVIPVMWALLHRNEVTAAYKSSSLFTEINQAAMAPITPISANDGSTRATEPFVRTTRGFDVAN